jgi:Enoyl-CoA hydratase/isomerase
MVFETLKVRKEGAVVFADIAAPPMNLLGPELVRDLVSLIQQAEADNAIQVLVFKSADPAYFISHVDVTRIGEYRDAAAKLTGEASLGLLFRYLSASRLVTIAQVEGRVRGAGSEFVLACDMRFAARESAIFGQPEMGFGLIPGAASTLARSGPPMLGRSDPGEEQSPEGGSGTGSGTERGHRPVLTRPGPHVGGRAGRPPVRGMTRRRPWERAASATSAVSPGVRGGMGRRS